MENYKENRPWGNFENLLDDTYCKVKKIVIHPEQAPSYQYHFKRSEVWVVVKGVGELKLNDVIYKVSSGDVLEIPLEAKHQIKNTGKDDLVFIEVQLGTYFGEDDIVRIEDNYGRI
jgi:mannose-6-phosphate isomerase-like protein (cupin superfamily)